jgi:hypothetical protein
MENALKKAFSGDGDIDFARFGIPKNFLSCDLREGKFQRIFCPGTSGKKNSKEFFVLRPPGRKIPKNFLSCDLREEKFQRIFLS